MAKNKIKTIRFDEFSQKMDKLCEKVGLSENDINQRYAAGSQICKYLQRYYPDCQVIVFGSTRNGFATKTSDLDLIFRPFSNYLNVDFEIFDENIEIEKVPSLHDIDSGIVSKEMLLQMGTTAQLSFVRKVLRRQKIYHKIMLITAKCPIINFDISYLNINCDISCGSRQVVYNSELLKFYSGIDNRVRPLVMTLREWAKSVGFIKSGILSSFGFTILVIFYLQSMNPSILPSVKHLSELADIPNIVDGWDVAFTDDITKVDKSDNTKTSGELFKDFFTFYWKYDFSTDIVSINSGRSLSLKDFQENDDKSLEDFKISPICIQDPFILSCNLGRNITYKKFASFKRLLFIASKMINSIEQPESSYDFESLFDEKKYTILNETILAPILPDKACSTFIELNPDKIPLCDKNEEQMYQNICQALLDVLQCGLLIDCEVTDGTIFKNRGTSNFRTKENDYELLISIQCAVFKRTYVGRTKIKDVPSIDCETAEFNNNTLKREYIISNYLVKSNPLISCSEPFFWFYCDCYKYTFDQLKDLIVTFTPLTELNDCRCMLRFLSTYIPKMIQKVVTDNATSISTTKDASTSNIENVI